jgi:hypothetical protein
MNFAEAVQEMLNGKRVRMSQWLDSIYLTIDNNIIMHHNHNGETDEKAIPWITAPDSFMSRTN